MVEVIPTVYTEHGPPADDEDRLVAVRLPVDVADELEVVTLWLSLQLGHRMPIAMMRRALVLGGLAEPGRILDDLRIALAKGDGPASLK